MDEKLLYISIYVHIHIPYEKFVYGIKLYTKYLPLNVAQNILQEYVRVLRKEEPPKRNISRDEEVFLRELKHMQDIVIFKENKGNATIVLDAND